MERSDEVWICSAGETFDIVALNVYGDEKYASEILSMNPLLSHKIMFDGGERIILPVVYVPDDTEDDQFEVSKAPWKE